MTDSKQEPLAPVAEDPTALKSQLEDLVAQATAKYAVKDYKEAAELYSRGTELQSEINGEMSTDNADLLYLYGRCLYHVAVINSDVLGTKVAGEKPEQDSATKPANGESSKSASRGDSKTEEMVAAVAEEKERGKATKEDASAEKPYFTFTGDENYTDSDEEEPEEDEGDAADQEDDFSNAFEVLDLARVLLERKLGELEAAEKGKEKDGDSKPINSLKERLADTFDLQAEISLENEQFPNAAADLRSSLELKAVLYPQESSMLAEAHYKLSLALEFSSVTQQKDANGEVEGGQTAHVDEAMREEAAKEMEAAIASCEMRIKKEEAFLKNPDAQPSEEGKKSKVTKASVDNVKDIVKDMKQRLVELRQPPVSINDPTGTGAPDGATPLHGILGSILGESPEAQKTRLEEASKGATDLTNLVKRKKQAEGENGGPPSVATSATGKRKAEDTPEPDSKKAKVEDVAEE